MSELRPVEHLQRAVWGVEDLEIVPATAMSAATHAGGLVVGAFVAHEMVGFAYGFVATPHGKGMAGTGLHSHMAAVLPAHRSAGVGRALKRYQAEWCRRRGLAWISWTFDPLLAKNARFNISVLGVRAHDYLVDVYGPMPGALGGGIASDRLLALWDVSPAVAARPLPNTAADQRGGDVWLLVSGPDGAPTLGDSNLATGANPSVPGDGSPRVRIAVPAEGQDVFADRNRAIAWREAHRRTLAQLLAQGYAVTGFEGGAYVLTLEEGSATGQQQARPQHL
ncbi:MAG TPA: GNAT family N-acetyltransferase [Trueperaceae bacterium]